MKNKTATAMAMALNNNTMDALEGFTFDEILASTVKDAEKYFRAERFRSKEFDRKKKSGGKGRKERDREDYKNIKNSVDFYRFWDLYTKGLDAYGKTHKIRKDEAKADEAMKNAIADDKGIAFDEADYYTAVDRKTYELEKEKKQLLLRIKNIEATVKLLLEQSEEAKKQLEAVEAQLKSDYIKV